MQPVRSIKNQYLGINAHLHSHWQTVGGWSDFHSAHITDLSKTLKAQLLPMGYTTEIEPSLQIRRVDDSRDWPESDITIYDLLRDHTPVLTPATTSSATLAPLSLLIEDAPVSEKPYGAVAVYEYIPRKRDRGEPVAWIELLSPANKGKSEDAATYVQKRHTILQSGLVFIEIDYLHETPSTFARLANYSAHLTNGNHGSDASAKAHPYRIVVLDPRPDLRQGQAYLAEFDVDEPIPTVPIPLNAGDQLHFDFGAPYRKTVEEELYGLEFVDYRELPLHFNRYSKDDQARIAVRMVTVLEATVNEIDLETGPFPVQALPLESALAALEALRHR
ncbi:MAG: DUF4058 family protein [Caldilineaceae bacterium]